MVIANTAGSIISHTTVISIGYLASPDSSGSLGIIIILFPPPEISGGQGSERVNLKRHCEMMCNIIEREHVRSQCVSQSCSQDQDEDQDRQTKHKTITHCSQ